MQNPDSEIRRRRLERNRAEFSCMETYPFKICYVFYRCLGSHERELVWWYMRNVRRSITIFNGLFK